MKEMILPQTFSRSHTILAQRMRDEAHGITRLFPRRRGYSKIKQEDCAVSKRSSSFILHPFLRWAKNFTRLFGMKNLSKIGCGFLPWRSARIWGRGATAQPRPWCRSRQSDAQASLFARPVCWQARRQSPRPWHDLALVAPGLRLCPTVASAGYPSLPGRLRRPNLSGYRGSMTGNPWSHARSIGILQGPARSMLAVERPLLNMLGRLSGIASLTRRYVDAVRGTGAGIYDTRKTTPGWRSLEKYAVRCGGGRNHRAGLFEAVLIKDNHLALGADLRPLAAGGLLAGGGRAQGAAVPWRAMGRRGPADDRGSRGRHPGATR